MLQYMLRLSTVVPDHKISIALFCQQGMLHRFFDNEYGAIRSFQRMRDVAEDIRDSDSEIEAYEQLAISLKKTANYELAMNVLKRML
jgi:hypothetical protein